MRECILPNRARLLQPCRACATRRTGSPKLPKPSARLICARSRLLTRSSPALAKGNSVEGIARTTLFPIGTRSIARHTLVQRPVQSRTWRVRRPVALECAQDAEQAVHPEAGPAVDGIRQDRDRHIGFDQRRCARDVTRHRAGMAEPGPPVDAAVDRAETVIALQRGIRIAPVPSRHLPSALGRQDALLRTGES